MHTCPVCHYYSPHTEEVTTTRVTGGWEAAAAASTVRVPLTAGSTTSVMGSPSNLKGEATWGMFGGRGRVQGGHEGVGW
jgi:hypothetical protein